VNALRNGVSIKRCLADDSAKHIVFTPGRIAQISFNRPNKKNALTLGMLEETRSALKAVQGDFGIRALVLNGLGPCFSSGIDVSVLSGGEETFAKVFAAVEPASGEESESLFGRYIQRNFVQSIALGLRDLRVPVIASIHNECYGAALQIALGACIRVAQADAKFSIMEIKHGLVPDMALTVTAPSVVREDVLRMLSYTADVVDADAAQRYGLVTVVSREQTALEHALALAERIVKNPALAVMVMKTLARVAYETSDEHVTRCLSLEEVAQQQLLMSKKERSGDKGAKSESLRAS
jgi:enoyl-CoA hydratase/carnithine racemase